MSNANGSVGNGFSAFLLGALVGGGLALLYSPQSGRETRDSLARHTGELKDRTNKAVAAAKDKIHEKRDEVLAAVDAGRRAMREQHEKYAQDLPDGETSF